MLSRRVLKGHQALTKIMVSLLIQCKPPDLTATTTGMEHLAQAEEAEGREIPAMAHKIKSLTTEKLSSCHHLEKLHQTFHNQVYLKKNSHLKLCLAILSRLLKFFSYKMQSNINVVFVIKYY